MGAFGDKFRKAREKKELSLDDVSNVTKISSRMLQAIEQEHFDQLPGGVFNKGFIRAYAKHLGLSPEDSITDYLACLRQAQIDAHEVWDPEPAAPLRIAAPEKPRVVEPYKPVVKPQPPAVVEELPDLQLPRAEHVRPGRKDLALKSTSEIPWGLVAATTAVIVLGVILWMRHTRTTSAAGTPAATAAPAGTIEAKPADATPAALKRASEKTEPQKTVLAPASLIASSTTPTSSASPKPQATARGPVPIPSPIRATTVPPTKPPVAVANNGDAHAIGSDVTVRTFPKATPKAADKPAVPLTLTIRATETSWISVLADGQQVSHETLFAPAHTSVRATHEIVARVGNAAGVTFLWNGQEIPAEGSEAEVKTFIFDATGMREVPTSQPQVQNQ